MSQFTRRDFLKSTVAVSAVAASGGALAAAAAKRSATDWVTLGNSGVKVTRLAFGTGTRGGMIQRQLGQDGFTRLVRHAYDRGIRFFETADSYQGMSEMLAIALKGIPRDSYRLMTKMAPRQSDPADIDRLRTALGSDYIDIVLLHALRNAEWAQEREQTRDALSAAKQKKIVLAHGASIHGLVPLRTAPDAKWLDVALCRINHNGTMMDNLRGDALTGDVPEVTTHLREIHGAGIGVLGMKIMGEGRFTTPEDRDASIKYVMGLGVVDAVTIGYKSPAEIDEAIERIETHLNA
jgi:aryl-alcohol dehydrogenase-like predicted oxidoreductase